MNFFPEKLDHEVRFETLNPSGVLEIPSRITAFILDEDHSQVHDLGEVSPSISEGSFLLVIPSSVNTLPSHKSRAARIVVCKMEFAEGETEERHSYGIVSTIRVRPMVNSFVTFERASLIAADSPNLAGWYSASDDHKKTALVEAFKRVTRIPMWHGGGTLRKIVIVSPSDWLNLSQQVFDALPVRFSSALMQAQILEANQLLQGDEIAERRRAGIIEETVGESTVKLDTSVVDRGICDEALKVLSEFIYEEFSIGRA